MPVYVLVVLLPTQLPRNGLRKPVEDDPSVKASATHVSVEDLDKDSGSWFQSSPLCGHCGHLKVNQKMKDLSLSFLSSLSETMTFR